MAHVIIECPKCGWQPDGETYWQCSCGHRWNTFLTKAKCPECGKQWEDTQCPACHSSMPHSRWYGYVDPIIPMPLDPPEVAILKKKKKRLEDRLIALGIKNYRVTHLPYLDHQAESFHTPHEAACRLLILYAVAYTANHPDERLTVMNWLKKEYLWEKVSPAEIAYLLNHTPTEEENADMEWRFEASLTLAWCLNLIKDLYPIDTRDISKGSEAFQRAIPRIGQITQPFFKDLDFRPLEEIHEENILNEMVTGYFRDLFLRKEESKTRINPALSFERHQVLNWLRKFGDGVDWDDTDTST